MACIWGHTKILKHLLNNPRVIPDYHSLEEASAHGNIEIINILLKDPKLNLDDEDEEDINYLIDGSNFEVLKLLLSDERFRSKLTDLEINKYTKYISK